MDFWQQCVSSPSRTLWQNPNFCPKNQFSWNLFQCWILTVKMDLIFWTKCCVLPQCAHVRIFLKGTKWLKRDVKAFHTIFSNLCVYFFHSIGWVWLSVLAGFRRSFASWNQAHGLSLRHCNYVVYQLHFDDSLRANVGFNWDPWSLMDLRGHFIPWLHFHCHWFTRN